MDKIYPGEFAVLAKTAVDVFVGEYEPVGLNDCPNCGGMGVMSMFLMEKGPFESPNHPYAKLKSRWSDKHKGWIAGTTVTKTCPVCNGSSKKNRSYEVFHTMPTVRAIQQSFPSQRTHRVINQDTGEREVLE